MDTTRHCSQCDAELPAEAEGNLCPKCVESTLPPVSAIPPVSQDSSPTKTTPESGDTIHYFGDYELVAKLGEGGMGEVWRARQVSLNRTVAVKLISAGLLATEAQVQRFLQEAETAASLDHPNIVPIYEVGEDKGHHYFSMKLVEGRTLAAAMPELRKDMRRAVELMVTVAKAVHHAHQRGILHRDIKPGNILIDELGQPHVTDFGLAKRIEGAEDMTRTGSVMGTPSYMSPEQASGRTKRLTTATDVYSLGAVLYEILTGQPPFRAETPLATLRQVEEQEPKRPSTIVGKLDRDLETICLKCLEKEPEKRYGSAEALAEDLERWLNHEPIVARPTGTFERGLKWVRRKPAVAALAFLVVLGVIVFTASTVVNERRVRRERDRATAQEQLATKARDKAREQEALAQREKSRAEDLAVKESLERSRAQDASTGRIIQEANDKAVDDGPRALVGLAAALRADPTNWEIAASSLSDLEK